MLFLCAIHLHIGRISAVLMWNIGLSDSRSDNRNFILRSIPLSCVTKGRQPCCRFVKHIDSVINMFHFVIAAVVKK